MSYPLAIGVSIASVIALLLHSIGFDFRQYVAKYSETFKRDIERADLSIRSEDYLLTLAAIGTVLWIVSLFVVHLGTIAQLVALPLLVSLAMILGVFYLRFRGGRRIAGFANQFEMVLRMMASALRVGLGFRQAIILVTDEVPDPARRELMRVIGRANIGVNLIDALDEMSKSVPSNETMMFARVVRVQSQTGGDLAKVLEKLATTIRDRRRVMRKMNALTAQGRFGACIIGGLPLLVGGFVLATQADMKQALLHTTPGWCMLGAVALLEAGAIFFLNKILQLDT